MLTRLYSPRRSEEGFTLIELLIVVIIIGILAAIALPIFLNQQKAAADASAQSDVRNTVDNIATWLTNSSNQNKAEANTGAFVTDGGKAVQSGTNAVGVNINTDGSYQVCGYTTRGNQFTSSSSAYTYDSTSGKFGAGSCVTGSDTGGNAAGATANPNTVVSYDFENGSVSPWVIGATQGGAVSLTVDSMGSHPNAAHYVYSSAATGGSWDIKTSTTTIKLLKGNTYTLSGYIYVASPTPATNLQVFLFYTPAYNGTMATATTAVTTAGSWQKVTQTITPAADMTGGLFMRMYKTDPAGAGLDVYMDDVSIVKQ